MSKIIGNTTTTPVPRSNWEQTDRTKADFIRNKPSLGAISEKDIIDKVDLTTDVQSSLEQIDTKASVVTLSKEEYEVLETLGTTDANTLYMLTDVEEGVQVYTQNDEPVDAPDGSVWIDTDDIPSKYEINAVLYTSQSLTEDQQAQARDNIGAPGLLTMPVLAEATAEAGKVLTITDASNGNITSVTLDNGVAIESVKIFGKNYFNCNNKNIGIKNGVNVEWDSENQEFILNGTTISAGNITLCDTLAINWEIEKAYTMTVEQTGGNAQLPDGASGTTFAWSIFSKDYSKYFRGSTGYTSFPTRYTAKSQSFASSDKEYIFMLQTWAVGTVFNNYRIRVQIEAGSESSEWEAYRESSVYMTQGYNNIVVSPEVAFTVLYPSLRLEKVDIKTYVDKTTENVLCHTPQKLTDEQKSQARTNIGSEEKLILLSGSHKIVFHYPDNVTIQQLYCHRYGRICTFMFQFIVNTPITASYGFTLATMPFAPLSRTWINNATSFYMEPKSGAVRVNNTVVAAGNYILSGFFITDGEWSEL